MPKEIKIISRHGNKTNDIKHFKKYIPFDCGTVVEPFAGSFAVSLIFDDSYKFHINDNDEVLYWIYNNVDEYISIRKGINDLISKNNDQYNNAKSAREHINNLEIGEKLKNYIRDSFIIKNCILKVIKNFNISKKEIEFLKNAKITKKDYKEIFEEYENDNNAFLFLDPPYMFSDNRAYSRALDYDPDCTDMLYIIAEYMKRCKCKVMLILNDLKIIRYLFGDMVKDEYNKIYQIGKREARHIVICNY